MLQYILGFSAKKLHQARWCWYRKDIKQIELSWDSMLIHHVISGKGREEERETEEGERKGKELFKMSILLSTLWVPKGSTVSFLFCFRGKVGGGREKHQFVAPLMYSLVDYFMCSDWE